jgi:NAD(P)H-hydrate repair Nnr-like enzyme with NAD(P)H-hydrate epimerase domain
MLRILIEMILNDISDLSESYSLLVDALSGNEIESTSNSQSAPLPPALLSYISQSTSPILSIDTPYGKDHDTSSPLASRSTSLSPDYLVCRGAVRKNAQASYDTYLVDVGLGPSLWARAGVDGWEKETFGAEFVVQCYRS